MSQADGQNAARTDEGRPHPFPRPIPMLPAWWLTGVAIPTPAQLARLDLSLAEAEEQPARPIYSGDCRAGR